MRITNKKTLQTIITMSIISVLIVTTYYLVRTSKGNALTNTESEKTQTELLVEEDIINKYPFTPKEVLELYAQISNSLYDKNSTDEQIEKLSDQMLLLFDDELLDKNPPELFRFSLKNEIGQFRDKNIDVMNYLVGSDDEAEFWIKENKEYASRMVTYTLKRGSDNTKITNKFLLRRDNIGKWRILGWSSSDSLIQENEEK